MLGRRQIELLFGSPRRLPDDRGIVYNSVRKPNSRGTRNPILGGVQCRGKQLDEFFVSFISSRSPCCWRRRQWRAGDTELRWKFKAGDKTHYAMKTDVTQDTKAGGMPFQVKILQTMDMTWDVAEVADDGTATLNQTIDRVRMEMTLPQAGAPQIKYDSQAKEKAPGTEMLSKIFDVIVGKAFVMKVTSLGKVLEMQAPDGVLQAFKNMPAGQGGMFSEDGLKQMISQSMLPLPEEAVAVGTTWEKSAEMQAPPFGKQVTVTQYKFAGDGELNGKKVDKIDVTMDIKLEAGDDPNTKFKLKDNKAGGEIQWDNSAGQPAQSRIDSKMSFEITANSMTIEQTVTTNSLMTRVPTGDAREL